MMSAERERAMAACAGERLKSRVAIVTGAGSGIGRAMTLRFSAEGARVLAVDCTGREEDVADEAGREVAAAYSCDITDTDAVAAMVSRCREQFGRVDILCNNAGVLMTQHAPVHETSLDEWDRVMNVNLRGAFVVMTHAIPAMLESGGGSVVITGSIGSFRAIPGTAPYIVSKAAVIMLAKVAALDYAQEGVRVNAICPGPVATQMVVGRLADDQIEQLLTHVPLGRLIEPEEVASLALFLASDEASAITGATYLVDGGWSAA